MVVTFEPEASGTLVRVLHRTADAGAAAYEEGWRSVLVRLGEIRRVTLESDLSPDA